MLQHILVICGTWHFTDVNRTHAFWREAREGVKEIEPHTHISCLCNDRIDGTNCPMAVAAVDATRHRQQRHNAMAAAAAAAAATVGHRASRPSL